MKMAEKHIKYIKSQCIVDNHGNIYSLQKKLGTSCDDIKHEHSAGVCSIDKQKIPFLLLIKVLI